MNNNYLDYPLHIFCDLILNNFYIIVLITGAERLKFAYIMIVYAALFRGKIGRQNGRDK